MSSTSRIVALALLILAGAALQKVEAPRHAAAPCIETAVRLG
jgi:hypothetical protein